MGINLYNYYNASTPQYQLYVDTDLTSEKKVYNLRDKVRFTLDYTNFTEKEVRVKFCSSENKQMKLYIAESFPYEHKKIFPKKYWIDNIDNIDNNQIKWFTYKCSQELLKRNGFLYLNQEKSDYQFTFEFTFLKDEDKYFLVGLGGEKFEVVSLPKTYYKIGAHFEEGLGSSGDLIYKLDKYLFLQVKQDKLFIFISQYDN